MTPSGSHGIPVGRTMIRASVCELLCQDSFCDPHRLIVLLYLWGRSSYWQSLFRAQTAGAFGVLPSFAPSQMPLLVGGMGVGEDPGALAGRGHTGLIGRVPSEGTILGQSQTYLRLPGRIRSPGWSKSLVQPLPGQPKDRPS